MTGPDRDERLDDLLEAIRGFWAAAATRRGRESRHAEGLSFAQMRIAAALYDEGPGSGAKLAAAAHCSPAVVSEMLDQLERRGIATRERSPLDRRTQTIELTDHGRALVERKRASLVAEVRAALAECSDRDLSAAARVLRRLSETVEQQPPHDAAGAEPD